MTKKYQLDLIANFESGNKEVCTVIERRSKGADYFLLKAFRAWSTIFDQSKLLKDEIVDWEFRGDLAEAFKDRLNKYLAWFVKLMDPKGYKKLAKSGTLPKMAAEASTFIWKGELPE